jgi:hypothetical protein
MKANHTFAIDFIARLYSDRKTAKLFVRITVNGDRKEISLKETINHKDWESSSETVKGKSIWVKSLNTYIEDVRYRIKVATGNPLISTCFLGRILMNKILKFILKKNFMQA